MLNNLLSSQNLIMQQSTSFKHLSPQALEALQTLEQIRSSKSHTVINPKIVRRVSSQYYQPVPMTIYGGRSASVFTSSPIKLVQQSDISHLTSISSFIQQQPMQKKLSTQGLAQSSRIIKCTSDDSRKPSFQTDRMLSHQNTQVKCDEPTPFFRDTISSDRNRCNQTSLSNYLAKHQLQQQIKTITQSSNNIIQTERLNEFKQQVQNDLLIETIISKFDSPTNKESFKKLSPQLKCTPITTPIVNSALSGNTLANSPKHEDEQLDSQLRTLRDKQKKGSIVTDKENLNTSTFLNKKKKQILNQILALDNQIKIMQDEETKQTLDPNKSKAINKQSQSVPCIKSTQRSEELYKQAQIQRQNLRRLFDQNVQEKYENEMKECTFAPKVNGCQNIKSSFLDRVSEWVKKKQDKLVEKQELNQEEQLKQVKNFINYLKCTFSPLSRGGCTNSSKQQVDVSDVYNQNQIWQQRVNMKKQKLRQSSLLSSTGKGNNNNKSFSNKKKKSNYHIDIAKLLKPVVSKQKVDLFSKNHQVTEIPITKSPKYHKLNISNQIQEIDQIDQKYLELCKLAQRVKIQQKFK